MNLTRIGKLILLIGVLCFMSCTKDFSYLTSKNQSLTVDEAKAYFYNNVDLPSTRSGNQSNSKPRGLDPGEISPQWKLASETSRHSRTASVGVPISAGYNYIAYIPKTSNDISQYNTPVIQKLVVVKDKKTQVIGSYVMSIIPAENVDLHIAKQFENTGRNEGFDGIVIYTTTTSNQVVRIDRYKNGVRTQASSIFNDKYTYSENQHQMASIAEGIYISRHSIITKALPGEENPHPLEPVVCKACRKPTGGKATPPKETQTGDENGKDKIHECPECGDNEEDDKEESDGSGGSVGGTTVVAQPKPDPNPYAPKEETDAHASEEGDEIIPTVQVENGKCIIGALAAAIQIMTGCSTSEAIDLAIQKLKEAGVNTTPVTNADGSIGIKLTKEQLIVAIEKSGFTYENFERNSDNVINHFKNGGQAIGATIVAEGVAAHSVLVLSIVNNLYRCYDAVLGSFVYYSGKQLNMEYFIRK